MTLLWLLPLILCSLAASCVATLKFGLLCVLSNLACMSFGQLFVKRFARSYRTVVCLSVCPVLSVLSVMLVYCGQTVGWIKMKLGMEVELGPVHTVLDVDPLTKKGYDSPPLHFSAHVYCG